MVQNPGQLASGKICVRDQAGFGANGFAHRALLQVLDGLRCPAALPHDGVVHRLSGLLVPDNGGLPLVGDADGSDIAVTRPDFAHGLQHDGELRGPKLHGVVFHPAGLGVDLPELLLGSAAGGPLAVEQDAPGAGRALVQGDHITGHRVTPRSASACPPGGRDGLPQSRWKEIPPRFSGPDSGR